MNQDQPKKICNVFFVVVFFRSHWELNLEKGLFLCDCTVL